MSNHTRLHLIGRARWLALVVVTLVATACLTGPRPTLSDQVDLGATGDEPTDRLIAALNGPVNGPFTASYLITNNFGQITRPATVAHDGQGRRSITIGEVRYLIDGSLVSTCQPATHRLTPDEPLNGAMVGSDDIVCSASLDDAAISDLQVTHQFYDRSAAARLTADARRRIGSIESYGSELASHDADCVSIPLDGGSKVYCILEVGILAAYQGPDVLIEFQGFSPQADEDLFIPHL
jgi:hypothetical protein